MNQVTTAAPPAPATALRSPVYAVASGKGGVGKTWLSVTLAHALARAGRRTLLFDGDVGLATVDVQVGLGAQRNVGLVVDGRADLRHAVTPYEAGGFDILAGVSGSGSLASLLPSKLAELGLGLRALAKEYQTTIVDLGAGLDRTVRRFTQLADECLVVLTDEPTALTDAYAFIKLTSREHPASRFRIVVNMAGSVAEGQRTYEALLKACSGFLQLSPPLAGIIRRDRKVAEAIRHQTPLLQRHPMCDAAQDVEGLAERLLQPRE